MLQNGPTLVQLKEYARGLLRLTYKTGYREEELGTTAQFIKNINIPIRGVTKQHLHAELTPEPNKLFNL